MSIYTGTFSGMPIQPANISYEELNLNQAMTQLQWQLPYQQTLLPVANYIAVSSNNNAYVIQVPQSDLVSVGQAIIFSNIGSNTFSVHDFEGGEIVNNIASGLAYYVILTDNSTQAGTWAFIQLGAGTSSADASALAGSGLIALGGKLNTNVPVTTLTGSSYTVISSSTPSSSDRAKLFLWTGGTGSLTLPVSGGDSGQAPNGFYVCVNNETTVSGIVTITPSGGQTIDNLVSFTLNPGESSFFISNGSGWNSLGYGNNANISIGVNNITATGGTYNLTDAQAGRQIQNISGTLVGNLVVATTEIPQQYYVTNHTTGPHTVSFQMQAGSNVNIIPQGTTMQFYCDATDVYPSPTNTVGQAQFNHGTTSNPSIAFAGTANAETTGFSYNSGGTIYTSIAGTTVVSTTSTIIDCPGNVLTSLSGINIFVLNEAYH